MGHQIWLLLENQFRSSGTTAWSGGTTTGLALLSFFSFSFRMGGTTAAPSGTTAGHTGTTGRSTATGTADEYPKVSLAVPTAVLPWPGFVPF